MPISPHRPSRRTLVVLFSWLLLGSVVWPGCAARYQPAPGPPALSTDPSVEAQTRLLQDARTHHAQGRYAAAVRLLKRFVSTYPRSSRAAEARWWLARSYEQLGDVNAALAEYRTLAAAVTPTGMREDSYEVRAMRRLEELRQAGNRQKTAETARTALMLSPAQLPPLADLEPWMQGLARSGVTTLVLEAVTGEGTTPPGVYFDTGVAPVHRDVFGRVLPMAGRAGLAVFASVPLQRMPWVDPQSDWVSVIYDPIGRRTRSSVMVDLLNPAVQESLIGLMADLVETGVEGVLVRVSEDKGFFAECGPAALKGFAASFGVAPEPARLCSIAGRNPDAMPQEFWRWVGWKSQERLRVLERIREVMRRKNPQVVVAIEIHREAVANPLLALVEYGEDLARMTQRGFDLILTAPQEPSLSGPTGAATGSRDAFVQWMDEQTIEPRRLWVTTVVRAQDGRPLATTFTSPADRALLPDGINLLYRVESAGAVP